MNNSTISSYENNRIENYFSTGEARELEALIRRDQGLGDSTSSARSSRSNRQRPATGT